VCRLKHVEPSINSGIINSTCITKLHLVGISTESSTMHVSMNIKRVVLQLGGWANNFSPQYSARITAGLLTETDWVHLAKDRAKWRAVVNSNVGLLCCMELVAWLVGYWVSPRLVLPPLGC
jgi:hypothetical protein